MDELEIVQYRQIKGLSIFFYTVDYRTPHFHPEWELVWLLENPLSVTCGQRQLTMEPGQMVLFPPNELHDFHKVDKSATFLCLQISPELIPPVAPLVLEGNLPHEYGTPEQMEELKERVRAIEEAYNRQGSYYELECVGQATLVLHQLLHILPARTLSPEENSSMSRRTARLKRLIRFVDENYTHKICLSDFARAEGCSMSYLSRFIKNTMNQNFQEYVASVRFNCACRLIAEGELRMLDICMESGFSDYRYFSRAFRQKYGMTPEEYSHYAHRSQLRPEEAHHSLHSVDRFYSREESGLLQKRYFG